MLSNILSFLDMNGYGIYVWTCFGLFLVVLTWQVLVTFRKNIYIRDTLKQNLWIDQNSDHNA